MEFLCDLWVFALRPGLSIDIGIQVMHSIELDGINSFMVLMDYIYGVNVIGSIVIGPFFIERRQFELWYIDAVVTVLWLVIGLPVAVQRKQLQQPQQWQQMNNIDIDIYTIASTFIIYYT